MDDFDRLSLKVLGSLKDIDSIRTTLIDILNDDLDFGDLAEEVMGNLDDNGE